MAHPQSRHRGPLRAVLDLFSSVWFGITLMVLIFIYCTIASAGLVYPTHWAIWDTQNWEYVLPRFYFDLTEMEAFHWWPFLILLALFSLNLAVVTVRRIPLNTINLGVWMIHTGILTLVGGSVYYFSTKVEGDTPVFRRQVEIVAPGESSVARLPAIPGSRTTVGRYEFEVASTNPQWPILSDEHAGKTTYSVQVSVKSPEGSFVRQLLAGYPQYTEDILPGQGRAKKALGKPLVDDVLQMRLALLPQDVFFIQDTKALYARPSGAAEWDEYALDDVPHFEDRIADRNWVWTAPGAKPPPIRPLDSPVTTQGDDDDPLQGVDVRVTGYLRYAPEESRMVPNTEGFNPVLGLTLYAPREQQTYELEALRPGRDSAVRGTMVFRWADSTEDLKKYERGRAPTLRIRVPAAGVDRVEPVSKTLSEDPELEFSQVEGSDYSYRVRSVFNNMPMDSGRFAGRQVSVALVEVKSGERIFRRWVADPAEATRDVNEANQEIEFDRNLIMEYDPGDQAIITLVGGPAAVGLHLFLEKGGERREHQPLTVGGRASLRDELDLEVNYFYPSARREVRPFLTPIHQRDRNAGATYSCIRVELRKGSWSEVVWLPFNAYALPDASYAYRGRVAYLSRQVDLPGGRRAELMFSRQRMPLGAAVALEDFELPTHTGGYTGSAITVRDYVSHVRFLKDGAWSERAVVRNNNPTEYNGWWYFQATWDPPSGSNAGGMNYTGLGVGNRNGVYIQLAGTVIAVLGMIYAFYVKPILKRRRREAVWTAAGRSWDGENGKVAAIEERRLGPAEVPVGAAKWETSV